MVSYKESRNIQRSEKSMYDCMPFCGAMLLKKQVQKPTEKENNNTSKVF